MTSHSNLKNSYEIPTSGVRVKKDEEGWKGVLEAYVYEPDRYYRLVYFQNGFTVEKRTRDPEDKARNLFEEKVTITKFGSEGYWRNFERWNCKLVKKIADSEMGVPPKTDSRTLCDRIFAQLDEMYNYSEFAEEIQRTYVLSEYVPNLFSRLTGSVL